MRTSATTVSNKIIGMIIEKIYKTKQRGDINDTPATNVDTMNIQTKKN